jgi:hypothetical protein
MQTYNKRHGVAESFSIVPSEVKPYIVVNQRLEERLFLWQWEWYVNLDHLVTEISRLPTKCGSIQTVTTILQMIIKALQICQYNVIYLNHEHNHVL